MESSGNFGVRRGRCEQAPAAYRASGAGRPGSQRRSRARPDPHIRHRDAHAIPLRIRRCWCTRARSLSAQCARQLRHLCRPQRAHAGRESPESPEPRRWLEVLHQPAALRLQDRHLCLLRRWMHVARERASSWHRRLPLRLRRQHRFRPWRRGVRCSPGARTRHERHLQRHRRLQVAGWWAHVRASHAGLRRPLRQHLP